MTKLTAWINGYDYQVLRNHTPDSKRKATVFATIIWLPVMLWAIVGFVTPYAIYGLSVLASSIVAIFAATAIFLLERVIIISNGSWPMAVTRIALGCAVAFLGAQFLDVVLFKDDVADIRRSANQQKQQDYAAAAVAKLQQEIADIEKTQKALYLDYQAKEKAFLVETDGRGGSGKRGLGPIAKSKKAAMKLAFTEYEEAKLKADYKRQEAENEYKLAMELYEAPAGVLVEFEYLNQLIHTNSNARNLYSVFTAFLFLIEFLVIIAKITSKQTVLEREVVYIQNGQIAMLDHREDEFKKVLSKQSETSITAKRARDFVNKQSGLGDLLQ
jgi:hypothetical protein